MLAATRFNNHCCRPNCRYILRNLNSHRCIQLEVLKPINKNDEITVFYGDNFFGEGNQDCLCVNVDLNEQKATPFQSVSISRQRLLLRPVCIRPRRKSVLRTKRRKTSPQSKFEMRRFLFNSSSDTSSVETLCTSETTSSQDNFEVSIGNAVSSPNRDTYSNLPALSVSTIEENANESSSADDCDFGVEQNCSFTNRNLMLCVNEIIARHGTSDAQVKD